MTAEHDQDQAFEIAAEYIREAQKRGASDARMAAFDALDAAVTTEGHCIRDAQLAKAKAADKARLPAMIARRALLIYARESVWDV